MHDLTPTCDSCAAGAEDATTYTTTTPPAPSTALRARSNPLLLARAAVAVTLTIDTTLPAGRALATAAAKVSRNDGESVTPWIVCVACT
jgi:hypothetical protein